MTVDAPDHIAALDEPPEPLAGPSGLRSGGNGRPGATAPTPSLGHSPGSPRGGPSSPSLGHRSVASMSAVPFPSHSYEDDPNGPPRGRRHSPGMIDAASLGIPGDLGGPLFLTDLPQFDGPSSAPPTPSVISVTHPSQFIHTHHPRRGSLTPLGLNVISPVPPVSSGSPMRSVGFIAQGSTTELTSEPARRDSVASTASNLTATRPAVSSSLSGFRRSSLTPSLPILPPTTTLNTSVSSAPAHRRSSLTPSLPTLSAPSPTRTTAAGRLSNRTPNSEGPFPPAHARTIDSIPNPRRASLQGLGDGGRRGSLPHLYYGAWMGSDYSESMATPKAPGNAAAMIDESFKFGSGVPPEGGAASSLQRIATLSSARRKEESLSAFELAEQQEADRQRKAFLAATYGEDSRRARARLSLTTPASPASTRRQSLLLWERINKSPDGSVSGAPPVQPDFYPSAHDDHHLAALRRPSLPIGIPTRSPPMPGEASFDDPNVWDHPDDLADAEETPIRPLPPLLPLSDPVPRLLPSTLALHRASHLLHSRNLESAPLPAPLPVTLHPPNPVDLSEFDIDFILAGSRTQLGRNPSSNSGHRRSGQSDREAAARANNDEEDSFAKFVGAFDDEYGGRRGDWTFHACPPAPRPLVAPDELDGPLNTMNIFPRVEWDAPGAGRFELYHNGDVKAVDTGMIWRICRTAAHEYELDQQTRLPNREPSKESLGLLNSPQPLVFASISGYSLASKMVHTEHGGVKLPFHVQRELKRSSRVSRRFAAATRTRQSICEPFPPGSGESSRDREQDRKDRVHSHDSDATATAATAMPISPRQGTMGRLSHPTTWPLSISPTKEEPHRPLRTGTLRRKNHDHEDGQKKSSFGDVLKRGLFKASSLVKDYDDRSRHLWPNNNNNNHAQQALNNNNSHASTPSSKGHPMRPTASDKSDSASASSQHSNASESIDEWDDGLQFGSLGLGIEDEQNGGLPWKEGKAWEGVPPEALAMVIPIESGHRAPPHPNTPAATQPFINPFFVDGPRQALLVWFTPFNAAADTPGSRGSSSKLFRINESPAHELLEGGPSAGATMSRLPKLLRPRGSRSEAPPGHGLANATHIPIPPPPVTPPTDTEYEPVRESRESRNGQPLPFRSFRVVAKVVDTEDLRSEPEVPVIALEAWTEQMRTGKPAGLATPPLEGQAKLSGQSASNSGTSAASVASAMTSTTSVSDNDGSRSPSLTGDSAKVMAGRAFPTVIAVCHSPASGVEFVLEGLDRLGLCKGESAWGPTGYEEWRGNGLSESGRQLLDLLFTACSAVMGL